MAKGFVMSQQRVERYKEELRQATEDLIEFFELVKNSPDKGFEKRDGSSFTKAGITKKVAAKLKEAQKNNTFLSQLDAGNLAVYNEAMSDIDTKIDELKTMLLDFSSALNKEDNDWKNKITACVESIATARGCSANGKEYNMDFVLNEQMCSANLKKDDVMSSWDRVSIYLTFAVRGFLRFFDEVQSLVSKQRMNDIRETPSAYKVREALSLSPSSQFFPKPKLSVDDAIAEWILVSTRLKAALEEEQPGASLSK